MLNTRAHKASQEQRGSLKNVCRFVADPSTDLHRITPFSAAWSHWRRGRKKNECGVIRMSQVDTCISGREWALHSDTHVLSMPTCGGLATADSADWFFSPETQNKLQNEKSSYTKTYTFCRTPRPTSSPALFECYISLCHTGVNKQDQLWPFYLPTWWLRVKMWLCSSLAVIQFLTRNPTIRTYPKSYSVKCSLSSFQTSQDF